MTMTREEAIKRFQQMKKILSIPNSDAVRMIEAIDMAIEALSPTNLKEEFESAVPNCQKCAIKELWEETEKEDLVKVVRCKDCRHKVVTKDGEYNEEDIVCDYWLSDGLDSKDFCSYGERRK